MREFREMRVDILSIDLFQPVSDLAVNSNPAARIKPRIDRVTNERVGESVY